MKTIIKYLLITMSVIAGVPILLLALLLYLSADGMCGNYIHTEVGSPDNRYKAVIFQRDCGATTDFSTQISIVKKNTELKNNSGNIFVVRCHPDSQAPELKWLSNTELLIGRQLDGTEVRAENSFGLIHKLKISYATGVP
ncbi:DUF5412 family protein [Arsukibacterium sp.]|uniref:DUF5412 family protein n=1 Tax=Arsukibacterium sp. TaxID=1977258 RepID=UPI002FDA4039